MDSCEFAIESSDDEGHLLDGDGDGDAFQSRRQNFGIQQPVIWEQQEQEICWIAHAANSRLQGEETRAKTTPVPTHPISMETTDDNNNLAVSSTSTSKIALSVDVPKVASIGRRFLKEKTGSEMSLAHLQKEGFSQPILVTDPKSLVGLSVPDGSVLDIRNLRHLIGSQVRLEVRDVLTRKKFALTMRECKHHFTRKANPLPLHTCLLYTSPSPRDRQKSRMPSSA